MKAAWNFLAGKKTYIGLALGGAIVIANKLGVPMPPGVTIDQSTYLQDLWMLALGAAARHGISTGA